jgi:hypothetical protein
MEASNYMDETLLHEISATSSRIRGVANWFRGDSNARYLDPNADELVEMMVRANNVRSKGGELPADVTQSLDEIWQNRRANYERNGLGTDCVSYEMLNDLYDGALSKEEVGGHCLDALRRIARGSLYTSQVRRDGNRGYVWDDARQLGEIDDAYELSSEREKALLDKYMGLLSQKVTNVPGLSDNRALQ